MRDLEYKITEEALQALMQGKKIVFENYNGPTVTLYPPRYGVFITHEKMAEIERAAEGRAWEHIIQLARESRKS